MILVDSPFVDSDYFDVIMRLGRRMVVVPRRGVIRLQRGEVSRR